MALNPSIRSGSPIEGNGHSSLAWAGELLTDPKRLAADVLIVVLVGATGVLMLGIEWTMIPVVLAARLAVVAIAPSPGTAPVRRRALIVALTAVLALAVHSAPARAQTSSPVIEVEAIPATESRIFGCDDAPPDITRTPGRITLTRTGDLSMVLTVDVTWSGSLLGDPGLPELPDPFSFPAGASEVSVELPVSRPLIELRVTVEPGAGYEVGEPSAAEFTTWLWQAMPDCDVGPAETTSPGSAPLVEHPSSPPARPVEERAVLTG